jgi:hypothetical protein
VTDFKSRVFSGGRPSTKQAIAIGLSKARRAGIKLKPQKGGTVSAISPLTASRRALAQAVDRLETAFYHPSPD